MQDRRTNDKGVIVEPQKSRTAPRVRLPQSSQYFFDTILTTRGRYLFIKNLAGNTR